MSFRESVEKILGQKTQTNEAPKRQPKYIFIGFFLHGGFGSAAEPHKANAHASTSITSFRSLPKLMTIMNCAPGNVLLGEDGGADNVTLTEYFQTNSDIDMTNIEEQQAKTHDQIISDNFLKHVNSGLNQLKLDPRDRIEKFKKKNPKDVDVCRNSLICSDKVGISHTFANKSFSTDNQLAPEDSWGIFIYNNNVRIRPGRNIERMIPHSILSNKHGVDVGLEFHLSDIISTLTERYELTEEDYLFLFDYSCSGFEKPINPTKDERLIRRLGNDVASKFGFGKKKRTKKRSKQRTKKQNKKQKKQRTMREQSQSIFQ
jgi:hypothetical protein